MDYFLYHYLSNLGGKYMQEYVNKQTEKGRKKVGLDPFFRLIKVGLS